MDYGYAIAAICVGASWWFASKKKWALSWLYAIAAISNTWAAIIATK